MTLCVLVYAEEIFNSTHVPSRENKCKWHSSLSLDGSFQLEKKRRRCHFLQRLLVRDGSLSPKNGTFGSGFCPGTVTFPRNGIFSPKKSQTTLSPVVFVLEGSLAPKGNKTKWFSWWLLTNRNLIFMFHVQMYTYKRGEGLVDFSKRWSNCERLWFMCRYQQAFRKRGLRIARRSPCQRLKASLRFAVNGWHRVQQRFDQWPWKYTEPAPA